MSAAAEVSSRRRIYGGYWSGADRATWLYAIAQNLDQAELTGLHGVGGAQVRVLRNGPLTAVVEWVDPGAFGAEKLQARLSDPAELEAVARRHHDVVVAVAALGPALPLRLATVYLSDDRVHSLLSERRDNFCQTLAWLAHRTECGIKALADPDGCSVTQRPGSVAVISACRSVGHSIPVAAACRTGCTSRRSSAGPRECGAEVHAALDGLAVASQLHPLHDPAATGDAGLQVLNAAYLVESASLPQFAESARAMATQAGALRVAVTGPWPAYSFADGPSA